MWTSVSVESRRFPLPAPAAPKFNVDRSNSKFDSDESLLEGLLADDADAWREFNTRYARLITSCITRVTARFSGVVRAEDVREIYATLCVQLLANDKRKLRSFEPERGSKLGTWLGLLASHTAYDFLRGVRREPKQACLSEAEELSAELPDPCEATMMRERAELVKKLLEGFSAKDREFISLYFGEGLEPDEVASRMGISVKTVYSKKHKIQGKLETLLSSSQIAA